MAAAARLAPARAVTTRSAPRTLSPAAKTPGRLVRPLSSAATGPQSVPSRPRGALDQRVPNLVADGNDNGVRRLPELGADHRPRPRPPRLVRLAQLHTLEAD